MDLVVQVEEQDGWAVARASGDLDLTTAPRLREELVRVVVGGQPRVILDLQEVDFVDSAQLPRLAVLRLQDVIPALAVDRTLDEG